MTHGTCRLTAKNWDQLRNPKLVNRIWATFRPTFLRNRQPEAGGMKPDKPKIGSIRSSVSIELQLITDEQLVDEAKARMAKMQ